MQQIVVVGTGYWGKNLVRNFAKLGVLAGVCDVNFELAQQFAEHYQIKVYTWEEVLADANIHAVVIAAPAALHSQLTEEALLAYKHVYVEKPLALTVKNAAALCRLAKQQKRVLMVGHLMQYHPVFTKLRKMVQEGGLGCLRYIYSNRLNFGKIRHEEDILWSFAPHDISMILALIGSEPEDVHAVGGYYLHKTIADTTMTHMSFANGVQAHVFVSWLHPFKEQKLVVVGDKAMAVFDDTKPWVEKLVLYPHKIEWRDRMPLPNKADGQPVVVEETEPLSTECQHFIDCMMQGKEALTNGEEGLRVLVVLDKATRSLGIDPEKKSQYQAGSLHPNVFVHETSYVDEPVKIGAGTKIWHYSHVLPNSNIGEQCTIGQNVMIGPDVTIGNHCKIQNNVSLYTGVELADGVFCGPSCVFTNVNTPRAEIERKNEFQKTIVEKAVTIGANATIVCGLRLGAYCFIGAGAVVTKDVKPHALMVGNPARQVGWVSHAGEILGENLVCPRKGQVYRLNEKGQLELLQQAEVLTEN